MYPIFLVLHTGLALHPGVVLLCTPSSFCTSALFCIRRLFCTPRCCSVPRVCSALRGCCSATSGCVLYSGLVLHPGFSLRAGFHFFSWICFLRLGCFSALVSVVCHSCFRLIYIPVSILHPGFLAAPFWFSLTFLFFTPGSILDALSLLPPFHSHGASLCGTCRLHLQMQPAPK